MHSVFYWNGCYCCILEEYIFVFAKIVGSIFLLKKDQHINMAFNAMGNKRVYGLTLKVIRCLNF